MHKIVSITLFSFLILFLILIGFFSTKRTEGEVLKSVDLQGCKLLSKSEYLTFAAINTEMDLKKYSLSSLREKFLQHPYVANASIVVDVDKNIMVMLDEKAFEATAVIHNQLLLIAADGKVVPVLPNTEVLDFPVLTNLADDNAGKELEQKKDIQRAFTIIRTSKKMNENLAQSISEINLNKGREITISLLDAKSIVYLGKKNLAEKIYTLDALKKQIGNKISLVNANYIDLRYTNNIFIGAANDAGI